MLKGLNLFLRNCVLMRRYLLFALLFLFLGVTRAQTVNHWETAVFAGDNWRYYRGTAQPNANWNNLQYSANSWSQGPGGIGYGDNDDQTVVQSGIASLYIRRAFNVTDTSVIAQALLDIDYDDAFIAYINGVEVARNNVGNPANYNTLAFGDHEAQMYSGGDPERYVIPKSLLAACLVEGQNLLAIQVHNVSINSGDISVIPFLSFGITGAYQYFEEPPTWFVPPFEFSESTLPIIVINTNGNAIVDDPRVTVDMGVIDNGPGLINHLTDPINDYNGKITIEYRGSSTQGFPKKQYGFSTVDSLGNELNTSILGLPKENDWILNAPYTDKTMIREFLIYNLAREIGGYATRTRYCELVVDGQYQGVYILLEKIKWDNDRVDIPTMDADDNAGDSLTGGYIFKIDKFTGSGGGGWNSTITDFQGQPKNIYFQYHYPKSDEITNPQAQYLQNYINNFETNLNSSNYASLTNGYRNFIDVGSFIDFFLFNEISKNVDGYRLSTFLHKQRASLGGKIFAGPVWDFNITLGNADYCGGDSYTGWALDFTCDLSVIPFWWHRLMQDDNYVNEMQCRWTELRADKLSTPRLMAYIDSVAAILDEPQQRNYEIWPILGTYVWPNNYVGNTYADELTYFKTWLTNRLAWMDQNLPSVANPICQSVQGGGNVVISEVNYHSDNGLDSGDWIELHNTTGSPVNVAGWVLKDAGITNTYTIPQNTTIPANGYLVLCENTFLFQQIHPTVTNFRGPFNFALGNSGDEIRIFDNLNNPVCNMVYADSAGWGSAADGLGFTLELLNPNNNLSDPTNWFPGCVGGSPGSGFVPCSYPIVFSEINYNSSPTADSDDWVELHNTTPNPIFISNYTFLDDKDTLAYTIPAGTILPPNGYLVLYADNALFTARHPQVTNKIGPFLFGLAGSGDACRLYDAAGKLVAAVRYNDEVPWPLTPDGGGYTLELLSDTGKMSVGTNWFAGCPEGSPGTPYINPCDLAVSENNVLGAMVYPNPFNDRLLVQWTAKASASTTIEVYDMYGKLVSSQAIKSAQGINRIDSPMPHLAAGMYLLRLNVVGEGATLIKVVKQ